MRKAVTFCCWCIPVLASKVDTIWLRDASSILIGWLPRLDAGPEIPAASLFHLQLQQLGYNVSFIRWTSMVHVEWRSIISSVGEN